MFVILFHIMNRDKELKYYFSGVDLKVPPLLKKEAIITFNLSLLRDNEGSYGVEHNGIVYVPHHIAKMRTTNYGPCLAYSEEYDISYYKDIPRIDQTVEPTPGTEVVAMMETGFLSGIYLGTSDFGIRVFWFGDLLNGASGTPIFTLTGDFVGIYSIHRAGPDNQFYTVFSPCVGQITADYWQKRVTQLSPGDNLIVAPTGWGKSRFLIPQIIQQYSTQGYAIDIILPRRNDVDDLSRYFTSTGVYHSARHSERKDPPHTVTICTPFSYINRHISSYTPSKPHVLILDEWHEHFVQPGYEIIAKMGHHYKDWTVVKITATPDDSFSRTLSVHPRRFCVPKDLKRDNILEFVPVRTGAAVHGKNISDLPLLLTKEPYHLTTTNVLQTSVTIPSVEGIIDSGFVNHVSKTVKNGILYEKANPRTPVSVIDVIQRTGRVGRVRPGWCSPTPAVRATPPMEPYDQDLIRFYCWLLDLNEKPDLPYYNWYLVTKDAGKIFTFLEIDLPTLCYFWVGDGFAKTFGKQCVAEFGLDPQYVSDKDVDFIWTCYPANDEKVEFYNYLESLYTENKVVGNFVSMLAKPKPAALKSALKHKKSRGAKGKLFSVQWKNLANIPNIDSPGASDGEEPDMPISQEPISPPKRSYSDVVSQQSSSEEGSPTGEEAQMPIRSRNRRTFGSAESEFKSTTRGTTTSPPFWKNIYFQTMLVTTLAFGFGVLSEYLIKRSKFTLPAIVGTTRYVQYRVVIMPGDKKKVIWTPPKLTLFGTITRFLNRPTAFYTNYDDYKLYGMRFLGLSLAEILTKGRISFKDAIMTGSQYLIGDFSLLFTILFGPTRKAIEYLVMPTKSTLQTVLVDTTVRLLNNRCSFPIGFLARFPRAFSTPTACMVTTLATLFPTNVAVPMILGARSYDWFCSRKVVYTASVSYYTGAFALLVGSAFFLHKQQLIKPLLAFATVATTCYSLYTTAKTSAYALGFYLSEHEGRARRTAMGPQLLIKDRAAVGMSTIASRTTAPFIWLPWALFVGSSLSSFLLNKMLKRSRDDNLRNLTLIDEQQNQLDSMSHELARQSQNLTTMANTIESQNSTLQKLSLENSLLKAESTLYNLPSKVEENLPLSQDDVIKFSSSIYQSFHESQGILAWKDFVKSVDVFGSRLLDGVTDHVYDAIVDWTTSFGSNNYWYVTARLFGWFALFFSFFSIVPNYYKGIEEGYNWTLNNLNANALVKTQHVYIGPQPPPRVPTLYAYIANPMSYVLQQSLDYFGLTTNPQLTYAMTALIRTLVWWQGGGIISMLGEQVAAFGISTSIVLYSRTQYTAAFDWRYAIASAFLSPFFFLFLYMYRSVKIKYTSAMFTQKLKEHPIESSDFLTFYKACFPDGVDHRTVDILHGIPRIPSLGDDAKVIAKVNKSNVGPRETYVYPPHVVWRNYTGGCFMRPFAGGGGANIQTFRQPLFNAVRATKDKIFQPFWFVSDAYQFTYGTNSEVWRGIQKRCLLQHVLPTAEFQLEFNRNFMRLIDEVNTKWFLEPNDIFETFHINMSSANSKLIQLHYNVGDKVRDFFEKFPTYIRDHWEDYLRGNFPTFQMYIASGKIEKRPKQGPPSIDPLHCLACGKKSVPGQDLIVVDQGFFHFQCKDKVSFSKTAGYTVKTPRIFQFKPTDSRVMDASLFQGVYRMFRDDQYLSSHCPLFSDIWDTGKKVHSLFSMYGKSAVTFDFEMWDGRESIFYLLAEAYFFYHTCGGFSPELQQRLGTLLDRKAELQRRLIQHYDRIIHRELMTTWGDIINLIGSKPSGDIMTGSGNSVAVQPLARTLISLLIPPQYRDHFYVLNKGDDFVVFGPKELFLAHTSRVKWLQVVEASGCKVKDEVFQPKPITNPQDVVFCSHRYFCVKFGEHIQDYWPWPDGGMTKMLSKLLIVDGSHLFSKNAKPIKVGWFSYFSSILSPTSDLSELREPITIQDLQYAKGMVISFLYMYFGILPARILLLSLLSMLPTNLLADFNINPYKLGIKELPQDIVSGADLMLTTQKRDIFRLEKQVPYHQLPTVEVKLINYTELYHSVDRVRGYSSELFPEAQYIDYFKCVQWSDTLRVAGEPVFEPFDLEAHATFIKHKRAILTHFTMDGVYQTEKPP